MGKSVITSSGQISKTSPNNSKYVWDLKVRSVSTVSTMEGQSKREILRCEHGYELPKHGCFGRAHREVFTASRRSVYMLGEPQAID